MPTLQKIKINSKESMRNFPSGSVGVTYISDKHAKFSSQACFAGIKHILDDSDCVYYLIGYYPDTIDYTKMKRDISCIFSGYLKIVWHNSGYKTCKIIEIRQKRKFPSPYIWLISVNLLLVMLRCMDREYSYNLSAWDKKTKIESLYSLLDFSYNVRKMYGHGVNDYFYSINSYTRDIQPELTSRRIKYFLKVLKIAFGKPNSKIDDFTLKGLPGQSQYIGQTPLFANLCTILKMDNVNTIK